MTEIKVKTKKELTEKVREFRSKGYMLITYTEKICELEKNDQMIVIKR